jgi:hypothetical protein
MTHQPTFFGLGNVTTRQLDLFERLAVEVGFSCAECGRPMVATASGFAACPRGHGRLHLDQVGADDPAGLWFEDEPGR